MRKLPNVVTVTAAAAERVKALMAKSQGEVTGLRIGIKTKGCSGFSYSVEYARERSPDDEIVEDKGITLFVDPRATLIIIGSEMDYVEDKLQSGFVFRNPNEKGRCGCGESFHV